jgi:hypothetical protein
MELVLWAALNDIACGTSETVPRIAQALDCMENIMSTQGFPDSVASWFGGTGVVHAVIRI